LIAGQGVDDAHFEVKRGDFFKHEGQYDFVYDYTFACAIEPSQRNDWAKKQAELVKPGGQLFTLIFPLKPDGSEASAAERARGPPFLWTVAEMKALVEGVGFKQVQLEAAPRSHPGREGKEFIGVWQRE
jgi:hypothetical protein